VNQPGHFLIELLNPAKHRREEFDCGVAGLNDFLRTQARKELTMKQAAAWIIAQ